MSDLMSDLKAKYTKKKILVVGLGLQGGGVGVAKFFAKLGAKVTATDLRNKEQLKPSIERLKNYQIKYTFGGHKLDDFINADLIFKGPSIPWNLPEIVAAQEKKIPIEMELSFFASICPAPIIGITGTRGKSTTTMMIYDLLIKSGLKAHLTGSLPKISTLNLLSSINQTDWVVMELPSWPLSGFHQKKISPHIAVFTNLYPDHLNYYKNMNSYFYDKKAIYVYQKPKDHLIINKGLAKLILNDKIASQIHYFDSSAFQQEILHLRGAHNLENAAAAYQVAKILNLNLNKSIKILSNFSGIPFRQEKVGEKNNIVFINDTTSTTPVATIAALNVFGENPIVLMLGGKGKNLPFEELIPHLQKVKKIILLKGSFTDEILPLLQKNYPEKLSTVYENLELAVEKAYQEAVKIQSGKQEQEVTVLFSPSATSFSMFNNEFHRGEEFNRIVNKLIA